jgi:hypothetical protein
MAPWHIKAKEGVMTEEEAALKIKVVCRRYAVPASSRSLLLLDRSISWSLLTLGGPAAVCWKRYTWLLTFLVSFDTFLGLFGHVAGRSVLEAMYVVAHFLSPIIPAGAQVIADRLGTPLKVNKNIKYKNKNKKSPGRTSHC